MSNLNATTRSKLPSSDSAEPKERKYPGIGKSGRTAKYTGSKKTNRKRGGGKRG